MEVAEEATVEDLQQTTTQIQIDDSFESAALASEKSGDYLAAAGYWQSLLDREPTNLNAAVGFAENLRRLEQYGHAIDVLQSALTHHPNNPELLGLYGRTLVSDGDASAAIEPLGQAATEDPNVWETYAALGVAYGVLGEPERANEAYLRALSISPGNPKVLNNMALEAAMNGNLDNAIELLERAVEHDEADVTVRQNLALMLAYRGDIDRAESLIRGDLSEDMADRNVAFYRSLAGDDLENIEDLVNQSSFPVEEEALAAPPTDEDSHNLAYVETEEFLATTPEFDSTDGIEVVNGGETVVAAGVQESVVDTSTASMQDDYSSNADNGDGVSDDVALAPQRVTTELATISTASTQSYVLNESGNISSVVPSQQPSPEAETEQGSTDDGALEPERFTRTAEKVDVVAVVTSPDELNVDLGNEPAAAEPEPVLELVGSITAPASVGGDVAVIDDQGRDELPTDNSLDLQYLESALE